MFVFHILEAYDDDEDCSVVVVVVVILQELQWPMVRDLVSSEKESERTALTEIIIRHGERVRGKGQVAMSEREGERDRTRHLSN